MDEVERLVRENDGLVWQVAKRYARIPGSTLDDLVAVGRIGLLSAARRYDPARGTRFSTYATHWIRHNVGRWVHQNRSVLHVPEYIQERLARSLRNGTDLSDYERRALEARSVATLEFEPPTHNDPSELATQRESQERAHAALELLDDREREIVEAAFGIGREQERLTDIGRRLGSAPATIRRVIHRALETMREAA